MSNLSDEQYNKYSEQNKIWENVLEAIGITPNDQTKARSFNRLELENLTGNSYPNKFTRSKMSGTEDTITNILKYEPVVEIVSEIKAIVATLAERERPPAEIKDALNARLKAFGNVRIAGRLTTPPRGNFVHLTDGINKLQIYCDKKGGVALVKNDGNDTLDTENGWAAWQLLDHGDFIGVEGYLFITNTGELSVHVEKLQFLAKAMLPMPDKMHGIADPELQRRFRYADLIASSLQVRSEPPALAGGKDVAVTNLGPPWYHRLIEWLIEWLKSLVREGDGASLSQLESTPPAYAGGSDLSTREVFERRAKIISSMRRFLEDSGYIEVETPMLTPKATGAAAKPFKTHHNALDIDLYARIAPELYLKRLVVGGFEKVYELNRNFRNEGISYKHNPEFTMLEFYCAYMDVEGMMNFCEELMRQSIQKATGGLTVRYEENEIDFSKFERITMKESIGRAFNEMFPNGEPLPAEWIDDAAILKRVRNCVSEGISAAASPARATAGLEFGRSDRVGVSQPRNNRERVYFTFNTLWSVTANIPIENDGNTATDLEYLFEVLVEEYLISPTFIIDYPKTISPLAKASPDNPNIAERFELFINGMEVANGFSELNDPLEQYERFKDQMELRTSGDEEAMVLDEDYIRALSYGMPPAAGIGIGIDRLVMLLTNKHSIRDVILFPHMRPERNTSDTQDTNEK